MIEKTRSFFKKLFIVINIGVLIAFGSTCLVPYLNTGTFWYFAFPGLGFALLFFAVLLFIIIWIVLRSKWIWVCLAALLIGIQQVNATFAFHLPQKFEVARETGTLRIMEWNMEGWGGEYFKEKAGNEKAKPLMKELIQAQNADILCFEEYSDIQDYQSPVSDISAIQKMGFPYYHFAVTEVTSGGRHNGVIIFSKYPLLETGEFSYGKNSNAEHLIYVDIATGSKRFRIFTTHLESVRFEQSDYESLQRLRHARDPGYRDSRTIISKLKDGYENRYHQAKLVSQKIIESPYPVVITGDFNDVPNSNTYFTIKGDLQDAFLKKGSWIGRTFRFISPTLRIDYILTDKIFQVNQFKVIHVPYSDHYPIVADLKY